MYASFQGREAGSRHFAEDFGGGGVGKGCLKGEEGDLGCVGAEESGSVMEDGQSRDGGWMRGGVGGLEVGDEGGSEVGEEGEGGIQ